MTEITPGIAPDGDHYTLFAAGAAFATILMMVFVFIWVAVHS